VRKDQWLSGILSLNLSKHLFLIMLLRKKKKKKTQALLQDLSFRKKKNLGYRKRSAYWIVYKIIS
jgi:hypothetical protein